MTCMVAEGFNRQISLVSEVSERDQRLSQNSLQHCAQDAHFVGAVARCRAQPPSNPRSKGMKEDTGGYGGGGASTNQNSPPKVNPKPCRRQKSMRCVPACLQTPSFD